MFIHTKFSKKCNKTGFSGDLYSRDYFFEPYFSYIIIGGYIMEEALAAVSAIVLLLGCYAGCGRDKKKKKDD